MLTGKLMFDIDITVENEVQLNELQRIITINIPLIDSTKINSCECVDRDIEDDEESPDQEMLDNNDRLGSQ